MKRFAVIGHPISHSLSPHIHNHWIKEHGVDGLYEKLDVSPDSLESFMKDFPSSGLTGINVTIPHKEAIIPYLDQIDEAAERIGAVNTVCYEQGILKGRNTDAFGFVENVKQTHPSWSFSDKNVLILGAGGAARAIIYGVLAQRAARVVVSNRTQDKAKKLASFFNGVEVVSFEEKESVMENIDMVINTTSCGMVDQPELLCDLSSLPEHALVSDIVYKPQETALLKEAKSLGLKRVFGIGMLLYQAVPAFSWWTGITPSVSASLQEKILCEL